jgi:hypothetical protein
MSKKHGEITIALGRELSGNSEIVKLGYSVIYDHGKGGDENVGVTSAWLGDHAEMDNRLSEIDIAIIERITNRAILLIEIEESGDNPKKIIGAAMATLFGDKISSSGLEDLQIGSWTTLLVIAKGEGESHESRTKDIEVRINQISGVSGINKMEIGRIKLALFQTPEEIKEIILNSLPK